jgi:copper chaperone CopZ
MKTKKGGGAAGAEDERRTEATTKMKKKGDGDEAAAAVVLRMELHCDGCALKVRKAIKGAESVRTDVAAGTVTVAGKADPWDLRDRIQARMARHKPAVDIAFVSPANPPRPPPKPKEQQQQGRRSINENKDDGDAAKNNKGKGRHDKDGNKQVHDMSSINFVQENCVRSMRM